MSTPEPLTFITETLPTFVVGQPADVTLEASGGAPPYQYNLASGALPQGLALSEGGVILGVVARGARGGTVVVTLTDANGRSVDRAFDVLVLVANEA